MAEMLRGVVKWFNDAKGFGFIEHTSGRDVFVHYSVIESEGFKTLKDGEEVDYELREGDKGLNASRVLRVNAPAKKSEEKDSEQVVAPKLQSGTVPSTVNTAADMIEVERQPSSSAEAAMISSTQMSESSIAQGDD